MARDLAHHISRIPAKALPSGFLEEAALHGSASDILARHSMASLMRRYSALLRVHLKHTEARLSKMDQEAALKRKRLEVRSRYRMECFCRVPAHALHFCIAVTSASPLNLDVFRTTHLDVSRTTQGILFVFVVLLSV